MQMEDRMTLCNMVVEAGGKNGVVPADATTAKYLEGKTSKPYQVFTSDGNARYTDTPIYGLPFLSSSASKDPSFLHFNLGSKDLEFCGSYRFFSRFSEYLSSIVQLLPGIQI